MQDWFAMPPLKPSRLPNSTRDLLALILLAELDSLNGDLDHYASPPSKALALLTKTAPFQD